MADCRLCDGRGWWVDHSEVTDPNKQPRYHRCTRCSGTGRESQPVEGGDVDG